MTTPAGGGAVPKSTKTLIAQADYLSLLGLFAIARDATIQLYRVERALSQLVGARVCFDVAPALYQDPARSAAALLLQRGLTVEDEPAPRPNPRPHP